MLPETIRKVISQNFLNNSLEDDHLRTFDEGAARQFGGGGGGCNDAYSAFAFLSFLFALLTFIQNNGGGGRKRRSTNDSKCDVFSDIFSENDDYENVIYQVT